MIPGGLGPRRPSKEAREAVEKAAIILKKEGLVVEK
jgi:hypothetical protein